MNSPAGAREAQGRDAAALVVEDLVAGYGEVLALDKVTIMAGARPFVPLPVKVGELALRRVKPLHRQRAG